ncbi:hypothetical protein DFR29_115166 [Tahibacter aquaticus]|uniref:Xaa-Pro dipeptidyl-peptidase C-terminal domain-containing protein n=1 Tax=Tahibacter aquaticus TaxID=520092 RepID=A0A4R6YPQ3_9GAMM|nr:CocE/NonD family hydrolase [Tahibacter aquaticus]TDR39776.1 hypothetical protein DFR29_115166 [Tahibacter aquaticus]
MFRSIAAVIVVFCLSLVLAPCRAAEPDYEFPAAAAEQRDGLERAMPVLAERVIAGHRDEDRPRYLATLFRLQLVAGRYADARSSIEQLRALSPLGGPAQQRANSAQYEIYALAREYQAREHADFEPAFAASFRAAFAAMDDRTAALSARGFASDQFDPAGQQRALDQALASQKGKPRIAASEALALLRTYLLAQVYRDFAAGAAPLLAEDDARRYLIERDILVAGADGAKICTAVVRPRGAATAKLPALLNFTIYADPGTLFAEARRSASNGYAAVAALTRGKGCSPDAPVPFEYDGRDAAAVIDWIAAQPWSDGRVGMFGGSYEGFTQWATARQRPKALKALMPSVTVAPGIDYPKEGGIFLGFPHYWPFYVTNNKTLDKAPLQDNARWYRMYRQWYVEGGAFRDRDRLDGTPNPIYRRWLDHPAYDGYWQGMIPYRNAFAAIDIPVLTTTGYFDGGQVGALHYLREHYRQRPRAEHYLLIGPYNHVTGQRGTVAFGNNVNGYTIDPVARIDIGQLRYQWFDYVFKGAPKPALLRDRINYEVMGADQWKHAPSLAAMGEQRLRLYFGAARDDATHRLQRERPARKRTFEHVVDLADRSDIDRAVVGGAVLDKAIDTADRVVLVSEPFETAVEFSGLFSGRLDLRINKRDMDVYIDLYELTPQGDYFQLSRYQSRLSYEGHPEQRRLLKPGRQERFDFRAQRLTSRQFQAGSRLVALIGPGKEASNQINYGSGKDVSDETVKDAGEPLRIEWSGQSYLEIPLAR